jgi:hypothetical protein
MAEEACESHAKRHEKKNHAPDGSIRPEEEEME